MKTDVRSAFNFSSLIINYLRYFQEFLRWIRNTWRPNNTANSKEKQYKITDLLWWERKEEIMDEILNLMGREYTNTKTKGWFQLLHRTFWIKWQMKTNKNYVGEVWKDKKCRMYDCWRSCNESKFSCSHHMPGIVQCWVYAGMPWSSFCGARTDFLKKSGNPDLTRLPKRIITGWAYFLSLWCFIPLRMGNKQSICMFISTVSSDNTALTTTVMKTFQSYWVSLASHSGKCMNPRLPKLCER